VEYSVVFLVLSIAGGAIFGFVLWLYAAHAFLTVLENTGSGADRIDWPADTIVDHIPKAVYLGWLVAFWLGPSVLVGAVLSKLTEGFIPGYLAPLVIWWAAFPLGVLSALSGPSVWIPLWPDVFPRLVQKPVVTGMFYALSAPVLIAFAVGYQLTFRTSPCLPVVGAPLMAVAWVLYARLIGRLAFVLTFTKPWLERRKVKPPDPGKTRAKGDDRRRVVQPSTQAPVVSEGDEVSGYDVKFDDDPPPVRAAAADVPDVAPEPLPKPAWQAEDDLTPYAALEVERPAAASAPNPVTPGALEAEARLIDKSTRPKKPAHVWTPTLLAFLIQPRTLLTLGVVTLWCVVTGVFASFGTLLAPPVEP
jgi:hypothetical protein